MSKTKWSILLAIVLCALLLPTTLIAKKQVERPMKMHGEHTLIVDLRFYPVCPWWIESEVAEATHLGRFTAEGGGTINLETGDLEGSGCDTAANGDELSWDIAAEGSNPTTLTFTGSTGRFESASGSVTITATAQTSETAGYLLIITESFSGIGTITH